MEKESSRFLSIYDVLGYIIPGTYFAVVLVLSICTIKIPQFIGEFYTIHLSKNIQLVSGNFNMLQLGYWGFLSIFIVIILYMTGHMIATVSHLTIDRILVYSLLTYPTTLFLQLKYLRNVTNKLLNIVVYNITLFIIMFSTIYVVLFPWFARTSLRAMFICYALLIALLVIRFLKAITAKEEYVSYNYKRDTAEEAINEGIHHKKEKWLRLALIIKGSLLLRKDDMHRLSDISYKFAIIVMNKAYNLLYNLSLKPLKKALFIDRYFETEFQELVKVNFKEVFNIEMDKVKSESGVYWMMNMYVANYGDQLEKYRSNWHHLYGLCRNTSTSAFLLFTFQIITAIFSTSVTQLSALKLVFFANLVVAIIFLMRYLVLYYNYYTRNLIRSFYIISSHRLRDIESK